MITNRSFMNQTWIDLSSPTKEEVDSLILTQNIDPAIAKDLLMPTPAQHIQSRDRIIYMVLHIPTFKHSHSPGNFQELDLIISENVLITARYDSIDALHYFAKQIEVNEILNRGENCHLFFGVMKEIYNSVSDELAYMNDWMKEIEKSMFEGREKDMVFSISNASRNLLNFKNIMGSHGTILESLKEMGLERFGQGFTDQVKILTKEWQRIMKAVNDQVEMTAELRETNNSMLSTKQNEIMKIFTIVAFITFPLSLIAAIFGMNIIAMPIAESPNAFWIIIGIMLTMAFAMFTFFRYKKWI